MTSLSREIDQMDGQEYPYFFKKCYPASDDEVNVTHCFHYRVERRYDTPMLVRCQPKHMVTQTPPQEDKEYTGCLWTGLSEDQFEQIGLERPQIRTFINPQRNHVIVTKFVGYRNVAEKIKSVAEGSVNAIYIRDARTHVTKHVYYDDVRTPPLGNGKYHQTREQFYEPEFNLMVVSKLQQDEELVFVLSRNFMEYIYVPTDHHHMIEICLEYNVPR